jgi:hypothetical protein
MAVNILRFGMADGIKISNRHIGYDKRCEAIASLAN